MVLVNNSVYSVVCFVTDWDDFVFFCRHRNVQ